MAKEMVWNFEIQNVPFVYRDIVDHMSKKDFEAFMDIHLSLCEKKSNLGYSEHGLIVAQK